MGNITRYLWCKIICFILVSSMLTLDIVWAHPDGFNARNSTLATPAVTNGVPIDGSSAARAIMLKERFSFGNVFVSIADYIFGDVSRGSPKLPLSETIEQVLIEEKTPLPAGVNLNVGFEDGVIIVRYVEDDNKERTFNIVKADDPRAKTLAGRDFPVSERYVVREVTEGAEAAVAQPEEPVAIGEAAKPVDQKMPLDKPDVYLWEFNAQAPSDSAAGDVLTSQDEIMHILSRRNWWWTPSAGARRAEALRRILYAQTRVPAALGLLRRHDSITSAHRPIATYLMGSYPWIQSPNDIDMAVIVEGEYPFTRIGETDLTAQNGDRLANVDVNFEIVGLETLKRAARGEEFTQAKVIRRKLIVYAASALLAGYDIFKDAKMPLENFGIMREDLLADAERASWQDIQGDPAKIKAKKAWRVEEAEAMRIWIAHQKAGDVAVETPEKEKSQGTTSTNGVPVTAPAGARAGAVCTEFARSSAFVAIADYFFSNAGRSMTGLSPELREQVLQEEGWTAFNADMTDGVITVYATIAGQEREFTIMHANDPRAHDLPGVRVFESDKYVVYGVTINGDALVSRGAPSEVPLATPVPETDSTGVPMLQNTVVNDIAQSMQNRRRIYIKVKADGVEHIQEILEVLRGFGISIIYVSGEKCITRAVAKAHYAVYAGDSFFSQLIDNATRPTISLVVSIADGDPIGFVRSKMSDAVVVDGIPIRKLISVPGDISESARMALFDIGETRLREVLLTDTIQAYVSVPGSAERKSGSRKRGRRSRGDQQRLDVIRSIIKDAQKERAAIDEAYTVPGGIFHLDYDGDSSVSDKEWRLLKEELDIINNAAAAIASQAAIEDIEYMRKKIHTFFTDTSHVEEILFTAKGLKAKKLAPLSSETGAMGGPSAKSFLGLFTTLMLAAGAAFGESTVTSSYQLWPLIGLICLAAFVFVVVAIFLTAALEDVMLGLVAGLAAVLLVVVLGIPHTYTEDYRIVVAAEQAHQKQRMEAQRICFEQERLAKLQITPAHIEAAAAYIKLIEAVNRYNSSDSDNKRLLTEINGNFKLQDTLSSRQGPAAKLISHGEYNAWHRRSALDGAFSGIVFMDDGQIVVVGDDAHKWGAEHFALFYSKNDYGLLGGSVGGAIGYFLKGSLGGVVVGSAAGFIGGKLVSDEGYVLATVDAARFCSNPHVTGFLPYKELAAIAAIKMPAGVESVPNPCISDVFQYNPMPNADSITKGLKSIGVFLAAMLAAGTAFGDVSDVGGSSMSEVLSVLFYGAMSFVYTNFVWIGPALLIACSIAGYRMLDKQIFAGLEAIVASEGLSFLMIKPDGIVQKDEIINMLQAGGVEILRVLAPMRVTSKQARNFYKEHKGKPYFDGLVNYITGGDVIPLIVRAEPKKDAIARVRGVVGPTSGADRATGKVLTGTVRGAFMTDEDRGVQPIRNRIHASDSVESVVREVEIILGKNNAAAAFSSIEDHSFAARAAESINGASGQTSASSTSAISHRVTLREFRHEGAAPSVSVKAQALDAMAALDRTVMRREELHGVCMDMPQPDERNTAVSVRHALGARVAAIDRLDPSVVPDNVAQTTESARDAYVKLTTKSIVASTIALWRRAKREARKDPSLVNQKPIIAFETGWIPGIGEKGHDTEREIINNVLREIRRITGSNSLRELGIEIICGDGGEFVDEIIAKAKAHGTKYSNIVILASETTLALPALKDLVDAPDGARPFIASVDPRELVKWYEDWRRDPNRNENDRLLIRLTEMLAMMLELAVNPDRNPPQGWMNNRYDRARRYLYLQPPAEKRSCEILRSRYDAEATALVAA